TAVKVMTPDHTHATVALAALRKGLNVIVHKPLANRLLEARAVIEAARAKRIATHFLPASEGVAQKHALDMVQNGAIGTLREIHTGPMRRMWPQSPPGPRARLPCPPASIGTCGSARRGTARTTPTTPTPISAAGTSSAAAPSPTWAITASGRSSSS